MTTNIQTRLLHTCAEIKYSAAPFLIKVGLTYFEHVRIFYDGRCFIVCNSPAYIENFFLQKYPLYGCDLFEGRDIFLWSSMPIATEAEICDMRNNFNIDHQITFTNRTDLYMDFMTFGTTPNRMDLINFYFNNTQTLSQQLLNYQEKFANTLASFANDAPSIELISKHTIEQQIGMKLFADITSREIDCLELLAKGYTSKIIARYLGISHRTVEAHFGNIKEKLNLTNKNEVIAKYLEYRHIILNTNR